MMKDFAAVITMLLLIMLGIVVAIAPTWLAFSVVTSGVKALAGNCGERYGIEAVVAGDWFCPSK